MNVDTYGNERVIYLDNEEQGICVAFLFALQDIHVFTQYNIGSRNALIYPGYIRELFQITIKIYQSIILLQNIHAIKPYPGVL